MTHSFKIGDKVKIAFPGHACARYETAEVFKTEAICHPEMLVLKFENGLIANCQPERLTKV